MVCNSVLILPNLTIECAKLTGFAQDCLSNEDIKLIVTRAISTSSNFAVMRSICVLIAARSSNSNSDRHRARTSVHWVMKVSRLVTNSAMVVRWASRDWLRRDSAVKVGWSVEERVLCGCSVGFDMMTEGQDSDGG